MKAAVMRANHAPLEIEDVHIDDPRAGEVLVKTAATGICHSDLTVIEGGLPVAPPCILGHEPAGIVEAVGPGVTDFTPGDHVIGCVTAWCGVCKFCTGGRPYLCPAQLEGRPAGVPPRLASANGDPLFQFANLSAFAERMLCPERALVKIRNDMPLDRAALIGCGVTTGLGAALNTVHIPAGASVVILGCGGVGLAALQGARIVGAGKLIAVDTQAWKLDLARTLGATDCIDASQGDAIGAVHDLTGGGADFVFECIGLVATVQQALFMSGRGGTTVLVGVVPFGQMVPISATDITLQEKRITGSYMGSNRFRFDMPKYVEFYLDGRLRLDEMISSRIKLGQVNDAFERMRKGEVARQVIVFDRIGKTMTPATPVTRKRSDLRFIIIGAGMAGILSAIKLREAGYTDVVVYEKADRLGGTWRENTYPGIACDVPSHLYSYSFAPNPEWSSLFSPGAEIQTYFEDVARRYDLDTQIQFGKEITRCAFSDGRWMIATADGSLDEGDFVIAATGVLHHPAYPVIEGLDSFAGHAFHSARWNHDVALAGKRVGVVGTGSSAIQIVAAIVDEVASLTLFQRTPQWIAPVANPSFSNEQRAEFRQHPEAIDNVRAMAAYAMTEGFANHLADVDSAQLKAIHDNCVANLENSVKDTALREKLRPTYRAACKRLIMSDGFYDAIQRPNARLVTEGIVCAEPAGVRTRDGERHELDVLVLATGFRVDRFMRPMEMVGRDGVTLEQTWQGGPRAYMALSIPDFPNLFMLNGPNSPVGNFSLIEVAELQFAYILQLIERVRSGACNEVSASPAAMAHFDAERRQAAKKTIWNSGCKSWYLDQSGLPTAWPWTFDRFRQEMAAPRFADFDMRRKRL